MPFELINPYFWGADCYFRSGCVTLSEGSESLVGVNGKIIILPFQSL